VDPLLPSWYLLYNVDSSLKVLTNLAEKVPLFLPSEFDQSKVADGPEKEIFRTEKKFRVAQADDALTRVRKYLRVSQALYSFKK
jgi:hypothetical protein